MVDFLTAIEEFCGDNYILMLVAAGVLLLLVIAVIAGMAVKTSHSKSRQKQPQDREYFLEGEYDRLLKSKAFECRESNEQETPEEPSHEEETEELSDQPVCININIQHGRVKIGYDDEGQISCRVESSQQEAETSHDNERPVETDGEPRDEAGQEIIMEKINLVKGTAAGKFGPDNLNTGRSGRIYTEEELWRRIKE